MPEWIGWVGGFAVLIFGSIAVVLYTARREGFDVERDAREGAEEKYGPLPSSGTPKDRRSPKGSRARHTLTQNRSGRGSDDTTYPTYYGGYTSGYDSSRSCDSSSSSSYGSSSSSSYDSGSSSSDSGSSSCDSGGGSY